MLLGTHFSTANELKGFADRFGFPECFDLDGNGQSPCTEHS